jgi:DNA sulfur modification protein DndC
MSRTEQLNLFGVKRIDINAQQEMTFASLNEYGPRHDHWAIAWSMGKDSTTVLTLVVQAITTGQVSPPKSLTVLCADTRLELIPLWIAAQGIIEKLRTLGIEVRVVMAPLDDRFFVYMLGRGVPPPSNRFRWCTGQMKVEPMKAALKQLHSEIGQKILMLTGVRQGESAIRDGRIAMSCSRDGAECGQGWYQTGLANDMCSTLAPILHWRVCGVWDWLKVFAPMPAYGGWPTAILADAYGGDEAEEINARTGCIGCPLASKDKALEAVVVLPDWHYLRPLLRLKPLYRLMKKATYRLRKDGERNKDGKLAKNQQRMGPLTLDARLFFLEEVLKIQAEVNIEADHTGRPRIDILNAEEEARIRELISLNTWPKDWDGTEVRADVMLDKRYADGSVMPVLFRDMVGTSPSDFDIMLRNEEARAFDDAEKTRAREEGFWENLTKNATREIDVNSEEFKKTMKKLRPE